MLARPDSALVNDQADPERAAPEPAGCCNRTSLPLGLGAARGWCAPSIPGTPRPTN